MKIVGLNGAPQADAMSDSPTSRPGPNNGPKTFSDAFKILEQAINDRPTPDLRSLLGDELSIFEGALKRETEASLDEISRGSKELKTFINDFSALGMGHARDVATDVGRHVRENAALYLAGAAVSALAIGFLLSRPRPTSSPSRRSKKSAAHSEKALSCRS